MSKMVILKPIVWNDQGYLRPAECVSDKGYPGEHGYGHEEWNARPDWIWQGWKIFHAQGKGRMFTHAQTGDLGMIMTAMHDGRFFAVGVACNVYENNEQDRAAIAKDLNLLSYGDELWKLPSVRSRKKDKADFDRHWAQAHLWFQWRCPVSHFHWFRTPIEIIPNDLIPNPPGQPPRRAIAMMFSSYQAIRPDQALSIVTQELPADHPIVTWLRSNTFDPLTVRNRSVRNAPPPRRQSPCSGSPAPDRDVCRRYTLECEIIIPPRHDLLQKRFTAYLESTGARAIVENRNRVDLCYVDAQHRPVLVEIKPTDTDTTRYAIRTAMGQLLDYRQSITGDPALLIVIGNKPVDDIDIALALSNGFGVAWPDDQGFAVHWPD